MINIIGSKKPRYMNHVGKANSYVSNGDTFNSVSSPTYNQLVLYDYSRKREPILFDGLQKVVLAVKSKLGPYTHKNNEIEDFISKVIDRKLPKWIGDILMSALWGGLGTSEIIYEASYINNKLRVIVDDLINYHPLDIRLVLDESGRLTHGYKVRYCNYRTGIWVKSKTHLEDRKIYKDEDWFLCNHVRLPKEKVFYTALNTEGNNPHGTSSLSTVVEYFLFKEVFRDQMAIALDRYGSPLLYAIVPPHDTNETIEEPDGSIRKKRLDEKTTEVLSNQRGERSVVFTQLDKDNPIQIGSLTTGNNFSNSFIQAMEMCDYNMMIGLGIPNLILKDNNQGLGSGGAAERQMEAFHFFISDIYTTIINDFLEYVIKPLIAYNFPSHTPYVDEVGEIKQKPLRWSELNVLNTTVEKLTQLGYISPDNDIDKAYVKELFSFPKS